MKKFLPWLAVAAFAAICFFFSASHTHAGWDMHWRMLGNRGFARGNNHYHRCPRPYRYNPYPNYFHHHHYQPAPYRGGYYNHYGVGAEVGVGRRSLGVGVYFR